MRNEFIPRLDFATREMMKVSQAIRGVYVFGSFVQEGAFNDIDLQLVVDQKDDSTGFVFQEKMNERLERLENKNPLGYKTDTIITRLLRHFFVNTENLPQGESPMSFPITNSWNKEQKPNINSVISIHNGVSVFSDDFILIDRIDYPGSKIDSRYVPNIPLETKIERFASRFIGDERIFEYIVKNMY